MSLFNIQSKTFSRFSTCFDTRLPGWSLQEIDRTTSQHHYYVPLPQVAYDEADDGDDIDWLIDWSVGGSVGQSVGRSVGWLIDDDDDGDDGDGGDADDDEDEDEDEDDDDDDDWWLMIDD